MCGVNRKKNQLVSQLKSIFNCYLFFDSISIVAWQTVLVQLVTIAPESVIHFFYTGYTRTVGTYDT